jgi:hypothetical protein
MTEEMRYLVMASTKEGNLCEQYDTYEAALARIETLPAEILLSMPLLFRELPDGSQRLVRQDGKPLQAHRLVWDDDEMTEERVPLSEEIPLGELRFVHSEQEEDEPPLPLMDLDPELPPQ